MGQYLDVEKTLVNWLATRFPSARSCTELPATLPAQVVQVVRFGGGRPTVPFDEATVDVDCYAVDRVSARNFAEDVSHALTFELPGLAVDGAIVLSAECLTAPSWAPYDNTNVRRMTAAYLIRTHNPI